MAQSLPASYARLEQKTIWREARTWRQWHGSSADQLSACKTGLSSCSCTALPASLRSWSGADITSQPRKTRIPTI
jgi:hypothetical protein